MRCGSLLSAALGVVAVVTVVAAARGEIRSASFDGSADSLDLTKAGTVDWAAFGRGERGDQPARTFAFEAGDFKKGGSGIARALKVGSLGKGHGGLGARDYRFTGGGWSWDDGTRRGSVVHWTGFFSGSGMIVELAEGGVVGFTFQAPVGETRVAYLVVRRDDPIDLVAVQAGRERVIHRNKGKTVGLARVTFDGPEPLVIELRSTGKRCVARGFAAALAKAGDLPKGPPPARTPGQELRRKVAALPEPDYLALARRYADHMIRHGRDRYGEVHSPLFASTLTRDDPPTLLPEPKFEPSKAHGSPIGDDVAGAYEDRSWWKFNRFVNIPTLYHLGSEDAHKETVVGEDFLANLALYRMLYRLTEVTGEKIYAAEAGKAVDWWFSHTQGPASGLYPWGEHLGWDFRHDAVSYSKGPVTRLYSCIYHEPRAIRFDDVLDYMSHLPPQVGFDKTPLERFALGLRDWHVWNVEKGYFTRHGDYFGVVKPRGNAEFPRIAGWLFEVWAAAFAKSKDPSVRKELAETMDKMLAAFERRVREVGFCPFTARHEVQGGKPEAFSPRQVLNMAAKVDVAGKRLTRPLPELSKRLAAFADGQIRYCLQQEAGAATSPYEGRTLLAAVRLTGRDDLKAQFRKAADEAITVDLTTKTEAKGPGCWSGQLDILVGAYELFGEAKYLDAARRDARLAAYLFLDESSPLPKVSCEPIYLPDGTPFPVYYHASLGTADLMYALCRLGAAAGVTAETPALTDMNGTPVDRPAAGQLLRAGVKVRNNGSKGQLVGMDLFLGEGAPRVAVRQVLAPRMAAELVGGFTMPRRPAGSGLRLRVWRETSQGETIAERVFFREGR